MSFADRARHAREKKLKRSKFKAIRAHKARQCKFATIIEGPKYSLEAANQAKIIQSLKKEIKSLKMKVHTLSRNASNSEHNQSTEDDLNQIQLNIAQVMANISASAGGQSYDRYFVC